MQARPDHLQAMIRHAVARSPYYRKAIGPLPDGGIPLRELPVMTKQQMMDEFDRIVTDPRLSLAITERHLGGDLAGEPLFGEYRIFASGGTSGRRSITVYDQAAWQAAVATLRDVLSIQEITHESRLVGIGSPTPLHMTNRLFPELHGLQLGAPRLAVTTPMPQVVRALNEYRPDVIITYPSFIRQLAEEQAAGRLRVAPRKFGSVAETLTQQVREIARATWGAAVLNVYGATEVGVIGAECPHARGLHVAEDRVVVEVVDDENQPVAPGAVGSKVLVTALFNRALPLIRYELPDLVRLAAEPCPCGRHGMRLGSVEGRREDVLTLPAHDGGRVRVHVFHLEGPLLRIPAVQQFQITPQADHLHVRVALRDGAPATEVVQSVLRTLQSELQKAGAAIEGLTVQAVGAIARSGTGAKQRLLVAQGG